MPERPCTGMLISSRDHRRDIDRRLVAFHGADRHQRRHRQIDPAIGAPLLRLAVLLRRARLDAPAPYWRRTSAAPDGRRAPAGSRSPPPRIHGSPANRFLALHERHQRQRDAEARHRLAQRVDVPAIVGDPHQVHALGRARRCRPARNRNRSSAPAWRCRMPLRCQASYGAPSRCVRVIRVFLRRPGQRLQMNALRCRPRPPAPAPSDRAAPTDRARHTPAGRR